MEFMNICKIPSGNNRKPSHYINGYFLATVSEFELAGFKIELDNSLHYSSPCLHLKINNKPIMIDLSDFPDNFHKKAQNRQIVNNGEAYKPEELNMPIFKTAYRPDIAYPKNIFPYGPYYIEDARNRDVFNTLINLGNIYNPINNNNLIKTYKLFGTNVWNTRGIANKQLDKNKLNKNINIVSSRVDTLAHWKRHGDCFSMLNISGSGKHTVDKNPIQAMLLGVCILHNDIDIMLPFNKRLQKDEHYISINDNYTNIVERINYAYENRT